jgi:hypothetical protein
MNEEEHYYTNDDDNGVFAATHLLPRAVKHGHLEIAKFLVQECCGRRHVNVNHQGVVALLYFAAKHK